MSGASAGVHRPANYLKAESYWLTSRKSCPQSQPP
jgi:hypothetical protein